MREVAFVRKADVLARATRFRGRGADFVRARRGKLKIKQKLRRR
jgi:hypothetical protein